MNSYIPIMVQSKRFGSCLHESSRSAAKSSIGAMGKTAVFRIIPKE